MLRLAARATIPVFCSAISAAKLLDLAHELLPMLLAAFSGNRCAEMLVILKDRHGAGNNARVSSAGTLKIMRAGEAVRWHDAPSREFSRANECKACTQCQKRQTRHLLLKRAILNHEMQLTI